MKYYVTMTDKFMSGWGHARNKINKLIFICNSYDEARIVADNASNRSDQKHINIRSGKRPWYPSTSHYVQFKDRTEYDKWYIPGYFNKSA